eukprot:scaffold911_cov162-Ochromonas_danica.AAC.22
MRLMTKLCCHSSTWHTCLYFLILLFPIYTFHVKRYGNNNKSWLSLRSSTTIHHVMMMQQQQHQQGSWPSTSLEEVTLYQLLQDKLLHHTSFSLPFSTTAASTTTSTAASTATSTATSTAATSSPSPAVVAKSKASTSSSTSSSSVVSKSDDKQSSSDTETSPFSSLFNLPQLSWQWSSASTTATTIPLPSPHAATDSTATTRSSTSPTTHQSSDKLITFHFKITKTASPQISSDTNAAIKTTTASMKSSPIFSAWPTLPASPLPQITAKLQEWSKHSTFVSIPPDLSLPSLPISLGWEVAGVTASLIAATGLALVTRSKRVDQTKGISDAKREKPLPSSLDAVAAQNKVGQALANSSVVLIPQIVDKSPNIDDEEPLPDTTPAEDTKELCRFLWRFLSSR